jgi:hypothetical protein
MTPTICLEITSLISVLTLVGMLLSRAIGTGFQHGELTRSVKELAAAVIEFKDLFKEHAGRIEEHEARLAKLEFCLDIDGKSMGIVQDVAEIHRRRQQRRRNGGNES